MMVEILTVFSSVASHRCMEIKHTSAAEVNSPYYIITAAETLSQHYIITADIGYTRQTKYRFLRKWWQTGSCACMCAATTEHSKFHDRLGFNVP